MTGGNWTLTHHRKAKGLSLRRLAALVGVAPSYLSSLEHGKQNNPSIRVCVALARELDIPLTYVAELLTKENHNVN